MSFLSRRKNTPEEPAKKPKAKDPDDYLLALDIGTEFVKALIAKKGKGTMKIVGVGKAHEAPTNMYAGAISDISGVAKTCEEALVKAEEMAGVRAQEVVVGIAGELIKGNTTSVKFRRADASKPINDEEMHKIIKQVQKKAGERARREVAEETNNPDVEVRLINSALVSLRIDGYKVTNPIGFKGKEVVVQIYTAFAPLVHISAIERVCDELQLDLVTVAVEPFAVCRACLGDDIESSFSGIVMDIGGGTTDIAVMTMGTVAYCKSLPLAGDDFDNDIVRYLRRTAGVEIGLPTAKRLKHQIGCVTLREEEFEAAANGKDTLRQMPLQCAVTSTQICEALGEDAEKIADAVLSVLEEVPPELFADICGSGLILCGGSSKLYGLDTVLHEKLRLPVTVAPDGEHCAAKGAGYALRQMKQLEDHGLQFRVRERGLE